MANDVGPEGKQRIFRFLVALAGADGKVGPEEERSLRVHGKRLGVSPDDASKLMAEVARSGPPAITDPEERTLLLRSALDVAGADGRLTPHEERLLATVADAKAIDDLKKKILERVERKKRESIDPAAGG